MLKPQQRLAQSQGFKNLILGPAATNRQHFSNCAPGSKLRVILGTLFQSLQY